MRRAGATAGVLDHRVMAPSTAATFVRAFTFGHTRQLDRVCEQIPHSRVADGRRPGDTPVTIDADSRADGAPR